MIVIRTARAEDAFAIGQVQVESWRSAYPGIIAIDYLVNLDPLVVGERWWSMLRRRDHASQTMVAVERQSNTVVGFGSCGRLRTGVTGFSGEIYALYLSPSAQGQGIGRRLVATLATTLLNDDMRSAVVRVLRENPSRWFYEHLGAKRLSERPIRFANQTLAEVTYGWRDLVPLAHTPANPWAE